MADPTLVATPAVTGGVPFDLVGDPSVAGVYLRAGADSLKLPIPDYDEDYAESADTEGAVRVRRRPTNTKLSVNVFVKSAASPAGVLANWKLWEQMIETMGQRKGSIVYTPRDGSSAITYLVEGAKITEAPQEDVMVKNGYAAASAEFTCRPYGLLPQVVSTLTDLDPFNFDTVANQEWRADQGSGNYQTLNGVLAEISTGSSAPIIYRPYSVVDSTTTIKMNLGASVAGGNISIRMKRLSATSYLRARLNINGATSTLLIGKENAGATTLQTGANLTVTANTSYWLQASIVANVITLKLFSQDPNAVTNPTQVGATVTATLAGGDATTWGAGMKGNPGLEINPFAVDTTLDEWRLDTTFIDSSEPLINCELLNVGGSVPALMEATLTDLSNFARNHVQIGIDDRYYERTSPQPILLDSDVLNVSGFEGAQQAGVTGAYNPKASGNTTIRATLSTSRKAICSTGAQQHIGSRRVLARLQGAGTGPIYARLVYRIGDGSWTKAPAGWREVKGVQAGGGIFQEVDFGTIQIPEGSSSWEGRIEAYSSTNGDTLDADYMEVLPALRFFKATTPIDVGIQSYLIAERFNQGAVNLTGQVVGGNGAVQSSAKSGSSFADAGGPGIATWNSPGVANVADGIEASAGATIPGTNFAANILRMTMGAGPFALPAGATIRGIEVKVKKRALNNLENSTGNQKAIDNDVRIIKNGTTLVGTPHADTSSDWSRTSTYKTYGGPNDLWGLTWTQAEINAAGFGVAIQPATFVYTGGFGISNTFYIDHIQIKVYYTDSAGNAWVITNSAGTAGQTDVTTIAGGQAQRTTVSDANLDSGRWSRAGGGVYDDVGAAITVYKTDQTLGAGESFRGGLILRMVDPNNFLFVGIEQTLTTSPVSVVKVYKRVGGTVTPLGTAQFIGSLAGGRRIFAQIDAAGNVQVWAGSPASISPTLVIGVGDPVLSTGQTLDDGFVGFYDAKTGANATTRNYDDFEVWTPDYNNPVIGSGGFYVVDHEKGNRASGGRPLIEGPWLKVNPSGREQRGAQLVAKARRNNVDYLPDSNIADMTRLAVKVTPRVALLNP